MIKLLAAPQNNIFVVGDDDQSIYAFRGARPEIMLGFEKEYNGCEKILLDINFRSQEKIVEGALKLISHNKTRFDKKILANRPAGKDVVRESLPNEKAQAEAICEEIVRLRNEGRSYRKMSVILRTNACGRSLLPTLMRYNIPFVARDFIPNLYDHWIAKDIFAYIRFAMGERSRENFLRIMNKPKRFISRESVPKGEVDIKALAREGEDKRWLYKNLSDLEGHLERLKGMPPLAGVKYIRNAVNYASYLKDYGEYRRIKTDELYEVLDELEQDAANYLSYEEWFAGVEYQSKELKKQLEKQKDRGLDAVIVQTMHSSKGLEYDVVFIPDAMEGICPHSKAVLLSDLEEERRMFYVAVTRAKEELYIYSAKTKYNKNMEVSRFVGETGLGGASFGNDTVCHKVFGRGKIIKREGTRITVVLERTGKEVVLDEKICINKGLFV
ncbi:MAG: ATP-dependent helicase [Lachnospiraceae bacterium]|nr:ATP-dependent helicase [Lachnospiraceae bacterium]